MARILIVDDENNIRMMLRLALQHGGHTVETAADGYEGLERFGDGANWDLVLLDQRMPGLEGLEVLREIRKRRENSRVILITAFGTIDLAAEAMGMGATNFLRKPFTVDVLRNAVACALSDTVQRDAHESAVPFAFDLTTVNGFRLRSTPGVETAKDGAVTDHVHNLGGQRRGADLSCRHARLYCGVGLGTRRLGHDAAWRGVLAGIVRRGTRQLSVAERRSAGKYFDRG